MRWLWVAAAVLLASTASARPLQLSDVLSSAQAHHPTIAAVLAKERQAQADLLAARGGFDPQLRIEGKLRHGGYYDLGRASVTVRQPTPLWGTEVWGSYRLGQGWQEDRFPSYYADETLDRGELRAGLRVPLWRDGPLDERRAKLERGALKLRAASSQSEASRLSIAQAATDAYFAWVAAGRRLRVAEEILALAERRQVWVRKRSDAGAIAAIDVLEAERAVLQRQRALVAARRSTEKAGLVLGYFYRTADGKPAPPTAQALPDLLEAPASLPGDLRSATSVALACHPLIAAQAAELAAANVDRDLARAGNAPRVDLRGEVSRDWGEGDVSLPGTVFEAGVTVSLPLAMRAPRGRQRAAEARAQAVREKLRWVEDTVRIRLSDASSAFSAAGERRALARRSIRNARQLASAEQRRFEAGATTLLVVNLREQSLSAAEVAEVEATRDAWLARAHWDALTHCRGS